MMKDIGGGLGILGALAGFTKAFLILGEGLGWGYGLSDPSLVIAAIVGGACAIPCFCLGIAAFLTGGRVAGILMLLPALLGAFMTQGFMAPAFVGAFLAIVGSTSRPRAEKFENRQTRLEKEVQQRYGAQR